MSAQPDEPTESTPENDPPGPDGPPEPEQPDTREQPEPEVVQPADADTGSLAKVVELHSPERGSLTLRPNQTVLDEHQKAALTAIGIDVVNDPGVVPHVRAFIHMCQAKALDPWQREAYLIGRGKGANRKYTMQTGIDGYRKMAASTGRFIRVKSTLWTGADDDDRSYVKVDDGDGGVIMKRVWFDQWPESRGNPGAAKVVIEHYDDFGNVVTTSAVADWGMYAPYNDVWEGEYPNKRKKIGPDGKPVQTLTDMWVKGGPHMLAKCAEALADRKAFPARMSGIYTHEEMHRLDQQERARIEVETRSARQEAYALAQKPPTVEADPAVDGGTTSEPLAMPVPVGDVLPETVASIPDAASPEQRVEWLHAELAWQADVLGQTVTKIAQRQVRAVKRNVEDFTEADLFATVAPMRPLVVARLQEQDRLAEAGTYVQVTPTDVIDVSTAFPVEGLTVEDVVEAVDPSEPHPFRDSGDHGACSDCGDPEDALLHSAE